MSFDFTLCVVSKIWKDFPSVIADCQYKYNLNILLWCEEENHMCLAPTNNYADSTNINMFKYRSLNNRWICFDYIKNNFLLNIFLLTELYAVALEKYRSFKSFSKSIN